MSNNADPTATRQIDSTAADVIFHVGRVRRAFLADRGSNFDETPAQLATDRRRFLNLEHILRHPRPVLVAILRTLSLEGRVRQLMVERLASVPNTHLRYNYGPLVREIYRIADTTYVAAGDAPLDTDIIAPIWRNAEAWAALRSARLGEDEIAAIFLAITACMHVLDPADAAIIDELTYMQFGNALPSEPGLAPAPAPSTHTHTADDIASIALAADQLSSGVIRRQPQTWVLTNENGAIQLTAGQTISTTAPITGFRAHTLQGENAVTHIQLSFVRQAMTAALCHPEQIEQVCNMVRTGVIPPHVAWRSAPNVVHTPLPRRRIRPLPEVVEVTGS